jgi:phosphate transport system substrate-binding protein
MCAHSPEKIPPPAVSGLTPIKGSVSVAVDRSLIDVARMQSTIFTEHYPEADVRLSAEPSGRSILRLLRREVAGAIIDGGLSKEEDSVMVSINRPLKRQPIARNALIFVVNRANPVASISVKELREIFSGRVSDWKPFGGRSGPLTICVDGSDFRLQAGLSEILFGHAGRLKGSSVDGADKLLARVGADEGAAAVVSLPDYVRALSSGVKHTAIKALPVIADSSSQPVTASPSTIYSGDYPLVTVVYYIYNPYDPLATGFGAWLAKEGQTLFERGDIAPYNQTVRTIILK